MATVYSCPHCGMVSRGETEKEVLMKVAEHSRMARGVKEMTDEARQEMPKAIRSEE